MNQTVYFILKWEKELEIQEQARRQRRFGSDAGLREEAYSRRERRGSIFPRIRRLGWLDKVQPQPACACVQCTGD